jgi:predicted RNA-binding Zn-ribbon protein involved in translation (DUF1610 family)
MDLPVELPLDREGYLRRQCPSCERVLKWRPADDQQPTNQTENLVEHHCPYCGEVSPGDQWWTDKQVEYLQAIASIEALRIVEQEFRPTIEGINRGSGLLSMEMEVPVLSPPAPLFEPDDMIAVEPPCHPGEPFKISEEWNEELHCRVCGMVFVLP